MNHIDYTKTTWVNNITPVNEVNMNHIESGIETATLTINAIIDELTTQDSKIDQEIERAQLAEATLHQEILDETDARERADIEINNKFKNGLLILTVETITGFDCNPYDVGQIIYDKSDTAFYIITIVSNVKQLSEYMLQSSPVVDNIWINDVLYTNEIYSKEEHHFAVYDDDYYYWDIDEIHEINFKDEDDNEAFIKMDEGEDGLWIYSYKDIFLEAHDYIRLSSLDSISIYPSTYLQIESDEYINITAHGTNNNQSKDVNIRSNNGRIYLNGKDGVLIDNVEGLKISSGSYDTYHECIFIRGNSNIHEWELGINSYLYGEEIYAYFNDEGRDITFPYSPIITNMKNDANAAATKGYVDAVDNKLNENVHIVSTSTNEFSYTSAGVTKRTPYKNLKSGTSGYYDESIQLANASTAGMMSPSDWSQIRENADRIASLEGTSIRLSYSTTANPTAAQIKQFVTDYLATRGITNPTDSDYNGVSVRVASNNHIWNYYANLTTYRDDGLDTVSVFTNDIPDPQDPSQYIQGIAGIIRGKQADGYVFAENDGTGTLYGWSDLKNRVSNNESNISSLQSNKLDKVTTATANDEVYVKAANGTQLMVPMSTSASGGTLVYRQSNGQLTVAQTPIAATDATSKDYVENTITTALTNVAYKNINNNFSSKQTIADSSDSTVLYLSTSYSNNPNIEFTGTSGLKGSIGFNNTTATVWDAGGTSHPIALTNVNNGFGVRQSITENSDDSVLVLNCGISDGQASDIQFRCENSIVGTIGVNNKSPYWWGVSGGKPSGVIALVSDIPTYETFTANDWKELMGE